MRCLTLALACLAPALTPSAGWTIEEKPLEPVALWPVDPLLKVFRDAKPPGTKPSTAEVLAARNEYESAQFVMRATAPLAGLRARVEGFPGATAHFAGFVPVRKNTPETPDVELVRKAPGEYPDPLLPPALAKLDPETSLPIWVTIRVPRDREPGETEARLVVEWDQGRAEAPLTVRVTKAVLPEARTLWVTNWFTATGRRMKDFHGVGNFSEEHWAVLRRYAEMMAAYRQSVVLTPIYELVGFEAGKDGKLVFDFARFDRWVRLFQDAGVVGLIEGGHLGGRRDWKAPEFDINIRAVQDGKVVAGTGHPGEPPVEEFLSQFFPALERHLSERGWLGIYLQHLCDEPIKENAKSYATLSALARKYAPRIRRIDANHYADLVGSIDVWVPQLNFYDQSFEFYQGRQKAGDEVWTYTCLAPRGTYPNRLVDYSLLKVRLLHWLNFRFGATGYLHWGWNQWSVKDPFTDVEPPHGSGFLPPGDGWIVYPSKEHTVLSSIRFEAMRDGIEDYELLRLLSQRAPGKAQALAERMIPKMKEPDKDVAAFRQARRELLAALAQ